MEMRCDPTSPEHVAARHRGFSFSITAGTVGGEQLIRPESRMITRFPGLTPTRSRAVEHDGLILTVAVAPDPVTSSMYEQSVKALARIDESLKLCGSDKTRILSAIVYIADMTRKGEMN